MEVLGHSGLSNSVSDHNVVHLLRRALRCVERLSEVFFVEGIVEKEISWVIGLFPAGECAISVFKGKSKERTHTNFAAWVSTMYAPPNRTLTLFCTFSICILASKFGGAIVASSTQSMQLSTTQFLYGVLDELDQSSVSKPGLCQIFLGSYRHPGYSCAP